MNLLKAHVLQILKCISTWVPKIGWFTTPICFHIRREASCLTKQNNPSSDSTLSPPLPFSFEFHFFLSLSLSLKNEEHGRLGTSSDSRDPIRSANTGASFPDSGGRPSCRIREYADERRFYSRPRYHLLWSHHYLHHRHQRTHLFRLTVLAELITCLRKVFSSPLLFVLSSFSKIDVRSGIFGYM